MHFKKYFKDKNCSFLKQFLEYEKRKSQPTCFAKLQLKLQMTLSLGGQTVTNFDKTE